MRKPFCYHAIYWAVILGFGLLLTGKAVACFVPSAMEMGQGKAMDCCADFCRMETSPETARQTCDRSLLAFSPEETLSSPHDLSGLSLGIFLTEINPPPLSFPQIEALNCIKQTQKEPLLLRPHQAVTIYTSIKTFLI